MKTRLALRVAYDGAAFRGFAENPGVRTIGGEIRRVLAQVMHDEPTITCAGRTDAGVHARGQVISFDVDADAAPTPERLRHALNGLSDPAITVHEVWIAAPGFDARYDATGRRYRYTVDNRRTADPLLRGQAWHVPQRLDLDAMNLATNHFLGRHDFSSFCRRKIVDTPDGEVVASRIRDVRTAEWEVLTGDDEGVLRFWIGASSFCQQMVRSIVGTLVDVGVGKCGSNDVPAMLAARDRNAAGRVAPPHGLVLWDVEYGVGAS